MKQLIIKFLVYTLRNLRVNNLNSNKNTCLLFHAFGQKLKHDFYGISIPINQFDYLIQELERLNFKFIKIDDIEISDTRTISVTIDDGYKDLMLANEILYKHKIPFTFYMITSKINSFGYLTQKDLVELNQNPYCTVGSHTVNHPYLTKISNLELLHEIKYSKLTLEDILGESVDHFSFPYGDTNRKITEYVKNEYKYVATSTVGHNLKSFSTIKRIEITKNDSFDDLLDKILGLHDFRSYTLKEIRRWF